jgi:Protein of unknown function (DUF3443)
MISARTLIAGALVVTAGLSAACGGGSSTHNASSASGSNVQPITVNAGPDNNYANGVFTTVTVCAPGTSNCTNVGGVLVDTGSFGLRVLSSALGNVASSLPQQKAASGNPVVECAQFVSSVLWGPVKTADISMAGEKATSVPIEVVDTSVPVPAGCKAVGPAEESLTSLGANGILGVGFFISDCGPACSSPGTGNPGFYYGCAGSSCQIIGQSESQQVKNPVALFQQNNNGVLIQLPAASGSAASLSGSMIFGIGTQRNNSLGSAQIFSPDNNGNLKTNFKGTTYEGFLDSGSNAYFFLSSGAVGVPECPSPESGFYCPSSPVSFSASNMPGSGSGASSNINFTIGNADQLFHNATSAAFPTLGGPNPNTFDWGLPFFFGRNIFVAYQAPAGNGPYWAY